MCPFVSASAHVIIVVIIIVVVVVTIIGVLSPL